MAEKRRTYQKRDTTTSPIPANEYGKLPPQALELEEDILGACLLEKGAYQQVENIITSEMFYKTAHQKIFKVIEELASENKDIDMHIVVEYLRKKGELEDVGGSYYIVLLTSRVSSAAHIIYHSQIIFQKYLSREMIRYGSQITSEAFNDISDVDDIIETAERELTKITSKLNFTSADEIQQSVNKTIDDYIQRQKNKEQGISNFIKTPLSDLNETIGGWQAPDLVVVAGRPAMGKTAFGVNFAEKAAQYKRTVFFALEMSTQQIVTRMMCMQEGINYQDTKHGTISYEQWQLIDLRRNEISRLNLRIIDDVRVFSQIRSICRQEKRKYKEELGLIVIDYLGLIKTNMNFGTRDLEIGYITSELKALCKELNVPIILFSQLNRPVKGMKVHRPQLPDLRESGNIEQDADMVMFIHRPEYYGEAQFDEGERKGYSCVDAGEIIIAKYREGETKTIYFSKDRAFKRIYDYNNCNNSSYNSQCVRKMYDWQENDKNDNGEPF